MNLVVCFAKSIPSIPAIDIVNPIPILIKIAANIPNINLFNTIQNNTIVITPGQGTIPAENATANSLLVFVLSSMSSFVICIFLDLYPSYSWILGDINGDGFLNVIDIVITANMALADEYDEIADINEDGLLNVLDVVTLVNIILNP